MNARSALLIAAAMAALIAALAAGYWVGQKRASTIAPPESAPSHAAAAPESGSERKVLYWYDPMYPQHKFDKPGKSPFMDMQLVPKYADEGGGQAAGTVDIDPRVTQNLGVRLGVVQSGNLAQRVDTVGTVQPDEHRIELVQSRAEGWVERLHVRAVNDPVKRGQLLAEIYAPDLLAAQEEYLLLFRRAKSDEQDSPLATAARQRLVQLGMSEGQIAEIERTQQADPRVRVYAPIGGVVGELGVRQGGQVAPGMNLFSLVDLSSVWLVAEVPELQVAGVARGRLVEARLRAFPGDIFTGAVDYVYPEVNAETRTSRVRALLRNPGTKLHPGMVANVTIHGEAREVLMVPSEAVIYTGRRTVVIEAEGAGNFRAVDVKTGKESDGKTEVMGGLDKGARVVVSGQFLIDSEAGLTSALDRLEGASEEDMQTQAAPSPHRAQGTVKEVNVAKGELVIDHGAFETLGMPAMTMGFPVSDRAMLSQVQPGEKVEFGIAQDEKGTFRIVELKSAGRAKR